MPHLKATFPVWIQRANPKHPESLFSHVYSNVQQKFCYCIPVSVFSVTRWKINTWNSGKRIWNESKFPKIHGNHVWMPDEVKEIWEGHFPSLLQPVYISRIHDKNSLWKSQPMSQSCWEKWRSQPQEVILFSEHLQIRCFRSRADVTTGISSPEMERLDISINSLAMETDKNLRL